MLSNKAIGAKGRALRSRMGLNTITLTKKMRLSQAQVSRLQKGLQGFRDATLLKFARVLGVNPVLRLGVVLGRECPPTSEGTVYRRGCLPAPSEP